MKKVKSLLIALVLALTCVSMITSTDFVDAASIKLNKTSLTLYTGKTSTLKVIGTNKKATWSTSNKKIATVSSKGVVSAKSAGNATITAKVSNKNLKCKVTIKKSTTSKNAAKKAYYNFLKSYNFTSDPNSRGFKLIYINNDSIPELAVFDGEYHVAGVKVYAYVNGKVKYVGTFGEYGGFGYKEKKGIICSSGAGFGSYYNTYYKWNGSKLSKLMTANAIGSPHSNGDFTYKYYINDKQVSYSKYKNSTAPYQKGVKVASLGNSNSVTDSVMKKKLL